MHSRILSILALLGVVAAVAIASCLMVFHWYLYPRMLEHPPHPSFVEQLDLTEAQQQRIERIDARFEEERSAMLRKFAAATQRLADLLAREDAFTEEVSEAIEGVHHLHGELQALSIRRYFSLLEELPPEKQSELRRLASEALSQPE